MGIPLRVLQLEDNPADAELVMHELRKAGYDPHGQVVETREDYLRGLGDELDLILADYNLPRFTAREALELLRARALDIPFIVLTGVASEEAAVEAMKRGAADYLLKDRLARLGPAVQGALEQKSLNEAKRKADAAQQESDRLYRSLFETSLIGLCLTTPEGKIIRANEALLKWCGFSPTEAGRFSILTQALGEDEDLHGLTTEIEAHGFIPQRSTRLRNKDGPASMPWSPPLLSSLKANQPSSGCLRTSPSGSAPNAPCRKARLSSRGCSMRPWMALSPSTPRCASCSSTPPQRRCSGGRHAR